MKVKVNWDTDGYSAQELGLPEVVDMPAVSVFEIADYLSDEYGYCVTNWEFVELESGYWDEANAWVLTEEDDEVYILVGSWSEEEALEAKEILDNEEYDKEFSENIHCISADEWVEYQDYYLSGEWREKYEC